MTFVTSQPSIKRDFLSRLLGAIKRLVLMWPAEASATRNLTPIMQVLRNRSSPMGVLKSNVRKGIKSKVLKRLWVPRGFAWGGRDFFPNRERHPRFGVQIVTFIRDLKFNTLANISPRGFPNSGWHPRFEHFSGLNRGWRPRFKWIPYRHSLSRWRFLFKNNTFTNNTLANFLRCRGRMIRSGGDDES